MKKVIYAKGITLTQAAREIEVGYHSLIKTLTPSVHIKKGGNEFRVPVYTGGPRRMAGMPV